ncbi:MAG: ATP-binding protein [Calditrichaeota bacterium]|nr:ATP-binding protein [Calditrichota bacterium]
MFNYISRYLEKGIKEDLTQKMVFVAGPRQCGKTTLAKEILEEKMGTRAADFYLTWDAAEDREKIIRERFPVGKGLLVLDEIHKFSRWRQVVKGLFDKRGHELKILVTGSGRLDYYRYGGDSLQGRYHLYRLYPFSFAEVKDVRSTVLEDLFHYSGFPEPFLVRDERVHRRWRREYRTRLIYEDLNSLEYVKDIALLEQLALRLPDLVGSPLSLNALREDLQVSHETIARWLEMFERIFLCFRIYPFGPPKIRAVKKASKLYLYDWTLIDDPGARFENLVAFHLLKWVHFQQDYHGLDLELRFFRDVHRNEVDFVVLENRTVKRLIECKLRSREVSPALKMLKRRFPEAEAIQISLAEQEEFVDKNGIRVTTAERFLGELI